MTQNRRRKLDARLRKADFNESYTQALRETRQDVLGLSLSAIPTPLPALNEILGGWKAGLITVASRPGGGKTIFAVNSAIAALKAKGSVLYFSKELNGEDLRQRVLSATSSVALGVIHGGGRTVAERDSFVRAEREISRWDASLTLNTEADSLAEIRAAILEQVQSTTGLELVIIDALELIDDGIRGSTRHQRMDNLSRGLKLLALELSIPIMVLAQLGRHAEERLRSASSLSTSLLLLSGSLGQDSDSVLVLRQPRQSEDGLINEIAIAKNRQGRSGALITYSTDWGVFNMRELDGEPILSSEADDSTENPEELTVYSLGEDGENWLIEGTVDSRPALKALVGWINETVPEFFTEGYFTEEELLQTFKARRDWFWVPLVEGDEDGERELCYVEMHSQLWTGQPLFSGIYAGL